MISKEVREARKLARERKKSNAAFKKMSKPRRRVRICKDVLAAIEAKKFVAEAGNWVKSPELEALMAKAAPDTQLDSLLPQIPSCNVCALGAIFLSCVERADNFSVTDYYTHPSGVEKFCGERGRDASPTIQRLQAYLGAYFDQDQLMAIEAVFEQRTDHDVNFCDITPAVKDLAIKLSDLGDEERLVFIMKNIIENKGTFRP